MTDAKRYAVECYGGGEGLGAPALAVFDLDRETAAFIVTMARLIGRHQIYKVERYDFRVWYFETDPRDDLDDPQRTAADADPNLIDLRNDDQTLIAPAGAAPPSPPVTVVTVGGQPATVDEEEDGTLKPLPDRLVMELTAYRTLALRDAVAEHHHVAMTLLLHRLVNDLFRHAGSGACLDAEALEHRVPVTEHFGQVPPWRSNADNPKDRLQKQAIVCPPTGLDRRLCREEAALSAPTDRLAKPSDPSLPPV